MWGFPVMIYLPPEVHMRAQHTYQAHIAKTVMSFKCPGPTQKDVFPTFHANRSSLEE